ncbi:hypothetical protein FA95DRAFT_1490667 [Auriscalpium vulgare]|uniref:Uncharacterized protein n=1 Tax=Auriscalpium vulgare TaxID=40419 RepID=A0ACB8RWD8_9AGAM|nr:hypothetical protein FA95DRAFT_1490667 [Auriscalpium vulgare]
MQAFFAPSSTNVSSRFLVPPAAPVRKVSQRVNGALHDDLDDFLSSDLELSFASTMSLHSPSQDAASEENVVPMDISPEPVRPPPAMPNATNNRLKAVSRPRAFTSSARLFGRDLSNDSSASSQLAAPSKADSTRSKRIQRSALPMEWLAPVKVEKEEVSRHDDSLAIPSSDAMDVDMSFSAPSSAPLHNPLLSSPEPLSAAPTITGFTNLFFDTESPIRAFDDSPAAHLPKKRRSASPASVTGRRRAGTVVESSPAAPSSPSVLKLERITSAALLQQRLAKPMLSGLGNPPENPNKRARRPIMSAMVPPSDVSKVHAQENQAPQKPTLPPPRRAFSAMLPPNGLGDSFSDESSFDHESSPAQAYAKRQQVKTIRRRDGTEDFRPLTGVTAMAMRDRDESPKLRASPQYGPGLGGFGDNETHGKVLPCHRVREDGLMRISVDTLDKLLDGRFNSQIASYQVIDCRFDYEYNGGHVPGAINMNTTAALEELLLGPTAIKPTPSTSADPGLKKILVFHCEFSVKRAPTFAKHLRSRDRALNNHNYPNIHFPEVYILEGGYCQYFRESASRCVPSAYVRMDDPHHAASRKEDLDQFRKTRFGRTKSYAYGDAMALGGGSAHNAKRNTAPSGGATQLFAAANAARTRRGGALGTLVEDGHATQSEDEETDIGDSPCPPPTKNAAMKGGLKKMALGGSRAGLIRAETFDPSRFAAY